MFQTKFVEKIKTYILFSITFFFENRAVFVKMWENILQPDRQHVTIWHLCIACWITKATNTHSEYVILIAFSPQQCLHESVLMLRYTYIACLVLLYILQKCRLFFQGILVHIIPGRNVK